MEPRRIVIAMISLVVMGPISLVYYFSACDDVNCGGRPVLLYIFLVIWIVVLLLDWLFAAKKPPPKEISLPRKRWGWTLGDFVGLWVAYMLLWLIAGVLTEGLRSWYCVDEPCTNLDRAEERFEMLYSALIFILFAIWVGLNTYHDKRR
jgi:hypothetical protein